MLCTLNLVLWLDHVHISCTVRQANLTMKRGCSHCKQCQEVERSVEVEVGACQCHMTVRSNETTDCEVGSETCHGKQSTHS